MKALNPVGVQTAGWYDEKEPLASLSYIRSLGFDTVDFNADRILSATLLAEKGELSTVFDLPTEAFLRHFEPLRLAIDKTGVTLSQMHAPFPLYFEGKDAVNEKLLGATQKCIDLCAYLSCPALVVHPSVCTAGRDAEFAFNFEIYRRMIPLARGKGVTLCIENIFAWEDGRCLEGGFSDARDLVRIIDALNEEAGEALFGACLDTGHAILLRRDLKDAVLTLGQRLRILHLHENNGTGDLHATPYSSLYKATDPYANWDRLIDGLREIGYAGALSFETSGGLLAYPKALRGDLLRLISAIGHSWAERISAD